MQNQNQNALFQAAKYFQDLQTRISNRLEVTTEPAELAINRLLNKRAGRVVTSLLTLQIFSHTVADPAEEMEEGVLRNLDAMVELIDTQSRTAELSPLFTGIIEHEAEDLYRQIWTLEQIAGDFRRAASLRPQPPRPALRLAVDNTRAPSPAAN